MTDSDRAPSSPLADPSTGEDAAPGHHEWNWSRSTTGPPSLAVVAAIAQLDGCDPIELPPLFEAVDPEGLDSVFPGDANEGGSDGGAERVSFHYYGYDVVVRRSLIWARPTDCE